MLVQATGVEGSSGGSSARLPGWQAGRGQRRRACLPMSAVKPRWEVCMRGRGCAAESMAAWQHAAPNTAWSQRPQRAQLLENAGCGGQQLFVPAQRVIERHVHLNSKQAREREMDDLTSHTAQCWETIQQEVEQQPRRLQLTPVSHTRGQAVNQLPITCTVALLPGVSLSLMRTIWERRMSGSAGGVVSLNVVCGGGQAMALKNTESSGALEAGGGCSAGRRGRLRPSALCTLWGAREAH